jgi:hypothetical protein
MFIDTLIQLRSRAWMAGLLLVMQLCCAAGHASELAIKPGEVAEFRVSIPANLRALAGDIRLSPVTTAIVDVAVPPNFDASREWPMLIVSASQDPWANSSRAFMREGFLDAALAAGWVVLAADPAQHLTVREDDTNGLHYALVASALLALKQTWPDSGHWPIAYGGFSGGSKRSGVLAFLSTVEGRTPIGMFLGGCNEPTPAWSLEGYGKPLPALLRVPVFLSSGDRDPVATPTQHRSVQRDLLATGFTRVRLETYAGRHDFSPEQVKMALDWFIAEHNKDNGK